MDRPKTALRGRCRPGPRRCRPGPFGPGEAARSRPVPHGLARSRSSCLRCTVHDPCPGSVAPESLHNDVYLIAYVLRLTSLGGRGNHRNRQGIRPGLHRDKVRDALITRRLSRFHGNAWIDFVRLIEESNSNRPRVLRLRRGRVIVHVKVTEHTRARTVHWHHTLAARARLTDEVPIGIVRIAAHDDPTDARHTRAAADGLRNGPRTSRREHGEHKRDVSSTSHIFYFAYC